MTRQQIYSIVENTEPHHPAGKAYYLFMVVSIWVSLIPLMTHSHNPVFEIIDVVTCVIFIIDYILRWMTADYRSPEKGKHAFVSYPVSLMAIVDLLSILPTFTIFSPAFKVLRVTRLFKIFRIFKFIRYYEPLRIIDSVIRKEGRTLLAVVYFAVFYILICALVMYNVEHDPSFDSFFDAIYWSCCTLTTVGYGDIYPISNVGRAFSMLSSFVGIALIALPSGIITSGYMEEVRRRKEEKEKAEKESLK